MALDPIRDSLDGLPEAVAAEYVQQDDGSYKLDVTPRDGWGLENISGMKKVQAERNTKLEKARQQLQAFEGIDPDEARKNAEIVAGLDPDGQPKDVAEIHGSYKSQIQQIKERHKADLQKATKSASEAEQAYTEQFLTAGATQAIAKLKGNPKMLLREVIANSRAARGDDGRFSHQIMDEDGNARVSLRSGSSDLMDVEEYVELLSKDPEWGGAFHVEPTRGSGGKGSIAGRDRNGTDPNATPEQVLHEHLS